MEAQLFCLSKSQTQFFFLVEIFHFFFHPNLTFFQIYTLLVSCEATLIMSDFDKETENFVNWVQKQFSSVSSKFEVADLRKSGEGRGLIATDNIKKGEILFELSRDHILNIDNAALTQLRSENKAELYALNQWQALIACVAYEWFLGEKSKFYHYFNVLPLNRENYSSLMFWNDEELQLLKPSGVLGRIGKDAAEQMYAILIGNVIPNKLKVPQLAEFLTLERFHIVASLIMSYSFDVDHPEEIETVEQEDAEEEEVNEKESHETNIMDDHHCEDAHHEINHHHTEDEDDELSVDEDLDEAVDPVYEDTYFKSMVPLADTLNSNTSHFNATLKYEKTKLVMVADKDIPKGEQIFNIYGELPNSEILRKYGYVELPSSKFEFAELLLSSIKMYFEGLFSTKVECIKEPQASHLIECIIETIAESEYLDEEMMRESDSTIISERYEIYANGEVLIDVVLLLQILTSILQAGQSDEKWFKKITKSIERKPSPELLALINRTILKSYQLIERNSFITKSVKDYLEELIKLRLSEYPTHIIDGTYNLPEKAGAFTKKELADVVLFNEAQCLRDVIDGKFPPKNEDGNDRYITIDDDKFLKNILKRKLEQEKSKPAKKHKK